MFHGRALNGSMPTTVIAAFLVLSASLRMARMTCSLYATFTPVAYDDYRVGVLNQRNINSSSIVRMPNTAAQIPNDRYPIHRSDRNVMDGNIQLAILYRHMEWLYLYFRIRKGIYGRG